MVECLLLSRAVSRVFSVGAETRGFPSVHFSIWGAGAGRWRVGALSGMRRLWVLVCLWASSCVEVPKFLPQGPLDPTAT